MQEVKTLDGRKLESLLVFQIVLTTGMIVTRGKGVRRPRPVEDGEKMMLG